MADQKKYEYGGYGLAQEYLAEYKKKKGKIAPFGVWRRTKQTFAGMTRSQKEASYLSPADQEAINKMLKRK